MLTPLKKLLFLFLTVNDDPKCNADFGFVLDYSSSVENHWEDEKSFVKRLIHPLVISSQGGQAAVTTFADDAKLRIKFSDHENSSSFENALDAIPYRGSTTKIDLGLKVALEEMFQEYNGMRSGTIKTLVLITDGQQTQLDFGSWRKKLNDIGIRSLVIGVGQVDKSGLIHFVNNDADFYYAKDFDELLNDLFIKDITLCGGRLIFVDRP